MDDREARPHGRVHAAVLFLLAPRLADSAVAARAGEVFSTGQRLSLAIVTALAVATLVLNVVLGLTKPRARLVRRDM